MTDATQSIAEGYLNRSMDLDGHIEWNNIESLPSLEAHIRRMIESWIEQGAFKSKSILPYYTVKLREKKEYNRIFCQIEISLGPDDLWVATCHAGNIYRALNRALLNLRPYSNQNSSQTSSKKRKKNGLQIV